MRHRKNKITLGRERSVRLALLRSLADSLIQHGAIVTTEAKAKALRMVIEPLITRAKKDSLVSRRMVIGKLYTDKAIKKLISEIAPRYKNRAGGYTRITKLGTRASDRGLKARIEFV